MRKQTSEFEPVPQPQPRAEGRKRFRVIDPESVPVASPDFRLYEESDEKQSLKDFWCDVLKGLTGRL